MPAVPANAAATLAESPPMAEVGESVKADGPRAVALVPDNEQDGPAPLSVDAPAPIEPPQEAAPVAPAPDPLPATVDAEIEAALAAEVPPDAAEKENPGIEADSS
jgi:hypothetical protein